MDDTIINGVNSTCQQNDTLYFLGDFAFVNSKEKMQNLRNRIVCKNIIFLEGNHDGSDNRNDENFKWILDIFGVEKCI